MHRSMVGLICAAVLSVGACGGEPERMEYSIFQNTSGMVSPGDTFLYQFPLPGNSQVKYTIENRSSTTPDHWDIAVLESSEFDFFTNGQPFRSFANHTNVSTTSGMTDIASAGNYAVAVKCVNAIENCQYSISVRAIY
jgi:hypothetical protein